MEIDRFWIVHTAAGESTKHINYENALSHAKRVAATLKAGEYVAVCPAVKVFYPEIRVTIKETSTNVEF